MPAARFAPVRILSGGQTGVDRAALDFAIAKGIPHGGWCPKGRRAEDGVIDARYALCETASKDYAVRTRRNVADADATLVLIRGELTGGTLYTVRCAEHLGKPYLVARLDAEDQAQEAERIRDWLVHVEVATLNIAGPRESTQPGIYLRARAFLESTFSGARDPEASAAARRGS
jgi:hypothetical protein